MQFSYDETDDFEEETDDFDDEPQDSFLGEEDDDSDDLEDDLEDTDTALSHAFREAIGGEQSEEDEDEDGDRAEETEDDDAETYEQQITEAVEALPEAEDSEVVVPPLELPALEVESFQPQEQSNLAYADAVRAYYEDKDYQRAIEKFGEAIENEVQHTDGNVADSNSVVAKAMYWQAEAYVKLQDIPQALITFESLIQTHREHYLSLAAERRTAQLNPEDS